MDARERRAGQREPRRRLRRPGRPAGRDDAIRATSAFRRSRRAASTARSAIRRRSSIATTSTSSCTTTCCSIAARIASSSAATTSTCSSGPSSPTTRAARSPTPGSSPATPSPISCSAIRRRPSSGIGRGDEDGRTNWLHLFAQDDWRMRRNLTRQPRPALRIQPAHARREQPAVVGGLRRRRAAASSSRATTSGDHQPRRAGAAAADPDSLRHVGGRPDGIAGCSARARCVWRRAPDSRCRSTTIAPSFAAATASS